MPDAFCGDPFGQDKLPDPLPSHPETLRGFRERYEVHGLSLGNQQGYATAKIVLAISLGVCIVPSMSTTKLPATVNRTALRLGQRVACTSPNGTLVGTVVRIAKDRVTIRDDFDAEWVRFHLCFWAV